MPLPLIEYRNVTVRRGERTVLDRLTLSIPLGQHVAILGPNGSGKSSLIKTVTRELYSVDAPDSYVRILGEEVWNIFDLRPLLGVVSQDWMEICTRSYSSFEIVLSGFFGSIGIWPNHHVTPEMERKAREVMELLEIGHLAGRPTDELSSGEGRRVLIGRALVHEPEAMILDEPSNSLDLHAAHALREILRRIVARGTSVILVTHHLPDIIPEIGRVILMREGRVQADGDKESMLSPERLSALFATRVDVGEHEGYYHAW
jgi:iron complex transport system ATP-binding protein